MIKEETYGVLPELKDHAYWADYGLKAMVSIDYTAMEKLADLFVGFSESPVGVYNHKSYEIAMAKFNSFDEIESFLKEEIANGKQMVLYYIVDNKIRFGYVS